MTDEPASRPTWKWIVASLKEPLTALKERRKAGERKEGRQERGKKERSKEGKKERRKEE